MARLLNVTVLVFAVTSMASVGMGSTWRQIIGPLRNLKLVGLGLIANFVLVPMLAVAITTVFDLAEPYEVGLLLVASAAGAPFLVKLVELSDGHVGFAGSLLILLLPATVVYMPIVVPLIAPDADVDAMAIATPLALSNLLPLAVGMVLLALAPTIAAKVRPILGPISSITLVGVVVLTVADNASELMDVLGQRVIIAAAVLIVGMFVIGFVLGTPGDHKSETALATAQRNIAAATVVATQAIGDPDTIVTVVVTSTVSMAVLFPLASVLRKRFGITATGRGTTTTPPEPTAT